MATIEEAIDDLVDDDEFWRFQANSLAVLITPDATLTFRLPNRLEPLVEVSDRFHIKPLLRCITVPQTAFMLALAQGSVRVVEVSADMPAAAVKVEGLPRDAASAVGKASILDRSPSAIVHPRCRCHSATSEDDGILTAIRHAVPPPAVTTTLHARTRRQVRMGRPGDPDV